MPWIGGAIVGGASLLSGAMGASAASDAAGIQAAATERAAQIQADSTKQSIAEMARQYNLTRQDQAPMRTGGNNALYKLMDMMGLQAPAGAPGTPALRSYDQFYQDLLASADREHQATYGMPLMSSTDTPNLNAELDQLKARAQTGFDAQGSPQSAGPAAAPGPDTGSLNKKFSISDFWNDPVVQASYQSGLDLGTKALKNSAPLTTGLDSGAAMKELTKFGTDYTGNMAAGSQNRFVGNQTNDYNRLMGIITGGQTANATTASAGSTAASGIAGATMSGGTNIANLYSSLGNAQGAAKIAGANSFGNGLSSVSNFWNQQQMLNRFTGGGGGYSANNIGSYGNFNMPPSPVSDNVWNT